MSSEANYLFDSFQSLKESLLYYILYFYIILLYYIIEDMLYDVYRGYLVPLLQQ